MKCFDNFLPLYILILSSLWILSGFKSIPKEICMKKQKEVAYYLKPLFLNSSTIDNVEILQEAIEWPENIIVPQNITHQNINFVLVVHSAIQNFDRRKVLRQQFDKIKQNSFNFRIIFVVGRSEIHEVQSALVKESESFNDIIQNYSIENYKHLSIKAHSWISYLAQKWSKINYIVKIDDDVSINFEMLLQFLNQQNDKTKSLFCSPMKHITDRRLDSKWYLSLEEFPYNNLGYFCAGLAYIITSDLLVSMNENIKTRKFVWLDDWYVTHALLHNIDFTLYDADDLYLTSEDSLTAFRKLRHVMTYRRPIPIFIHLRPRNFLSLEKQNELWAYSQPCKNS